ncbi:MAG: putative toxin [Actinomycetota bacterium]|nr:putative toxin [Actinomycetota bacterium]
MIAVGLMSLLAIPASASSLVGAGNGVGVIAYAGGQRVGPHEQILAGQGRARAPNYDQLVVGHCVGAEDAGMAGVRAAGSAGENAAGIIKNTDRIPSLSGTAAYRIPDELNSSVIGEVKNVSSLSYTSQLRDLEAYAQQDGLTFNLYVRGSTTLSGPLQDAVNAGDINLIRNLP